MRIRISNSGMAVDADKVFVLTPSNGVARKLRGPHSKVKLASYARQLHALVRTNVGPDAYNTRLNKPVMRD